MDENVRTFVGYNYGRFRNDRGQMQPYCNVFLLEEFSGEENEDYHFSGQKAVKYSCASPEVYKGVSIGELVTCFFDEKKKVVYMRTAS